MHQEGRKKQFDEGFKVARKNCHDSITGHLGEGDLELFLKWQKELLLIQRSWKLSKPAQGKSQTIIWRSSEKWHTQIGKETMVMEQLGKRKAHSRWYRGYNLVSEYALQNLSISIFIKVLPTSVPRILATQHTTMMNGDGGCRCKGGQHFLGFHLSEAKGAKSGWSTERHLALRF